MCGSVVLKDIKHRVSIDACQTIHIVFLWIQIHLSIIISYPPSIHLSTTYTVSRDQEQLKAMPYKHINFYHFFFCMKI